MITKDELMEVTDRKDRFELSMIYMMLHGSGTFIETLTLDDVKAIRSTVLYVCNSMDYNSQKEGTEYFNIKTGDKAYQGMLDLREKQAAEATKQELDVYNTFCRYGIFAKMRDDATCRIMNRDKQQLKD